jgi:hypothetical protein
MFEYFQINISSGNYGTLLNRLSHYRVCQLSQGLFLVNTGPVTTDLGLPKFHIYSSLTA